MFLVVSGGVSILEDGRPEPLAELDRGNFFGEIALIQGTTRMASAVAVSNTEVLTIRKDAFDVLHRRSASFRRAARLLAEMRLEANVAPQPDPELVWLVNDQGYDRLRLRDLQTGADLPAPELPAGARPHLTGAEPPLALSADGSHAALIVSSPRRPPEAWVVETESGRSWPVTDSRLGGLHEDDLVDVELVSFPTFDGRDIPASSRSGLCRA